MSAIPLTLTDAAKDRLVASAAGEGDVSGILLSIAAGRGCGGNEYQMDFVRTDDDTADFEVISVNESLNLYIPIKDSLKFFGMDIDYGTDSLGNGSFLFTNPNEASRCGCGKSFSLEEMTEAMDS